MASLASASPIPIHSYSFDARRHPSRLASRTTATRQQTKHSPPASDSFHRSYPRPADSSDDEDLAPIKLSAEAQAILGEEATHGHLEKESAALQKPYSVSHQQVSSSQHPALAQKESGSPVSRPSRITKTSRPSPPAVLERDGSFAYKFYDKSKSFGALDRESKTPAPRLRKVRVSGSRSQTKSPSSTEAVADRDLHHNNGEEQTPGEAEQNSSPEIEESNIGPATVTRPRRTKENGIHSTLRAHKIGTGTLLNGPVRRGLIRRHSQDEEVHGNENEQPEYSPEVQHGRRAEPELDNRPDDLLIDYESPKPRKTAASAMLDQNGMMQRSKSPIAEAAERPQSPPKPVIFSASIGRQPTPVAANVLNSSRSSSSKRPVFKIPAPPPVEHTNDQENEPPPTFRRSKPTPAQFEIHEDNVREPERKSTRHDASRESPSRQPLAARHENTPHRAPPPPPKMSLVEAATSNAGNSRAKKSVHYVLNGRTYRRLNCIGKGGSSRVFRVMAESFNIFALKRVNLEEADMAAIAGYKGEIELLKKLEHVDRVIRLFDYEINEDKGVLNVMMELGETDFNKMLNEQLKGDSSKLDITFTRHYWKEMLECVQAIHNHDIVHSDLKPANFLLVKGQLKLIDFGIANAIQDNTVNVHRENQIGTPNYMSPESLVTVTGQSAGTKLLKLGKPSDVWSLGCILYQMTYGQPPFAHIAKQFDRIMSIPNPKVEIQYPGTGIGGSVVPFGLIKTLKRCLQRDQTLRPTISELLSDADPFLNPVAISPDMLGRVIGNVVSYCRKREESFRQAGQLGQEGISCLPRDEDMRGWPLAFYEKLKQAQEEGTAW